jgi:predicted  nucleic acid-binding Zn-ribbon protein
MDSMTNEQMLEDLKQFIAVQTTDIRDDIADVKRNVERLEKKVDDGFAGISTIIETINTRIDHVEDKVDEMDIQLKRLKHRAA